MPSQNILSWAWQQVPWLQILEYEYNISWFRYLAASKVNRNCSLIIALHDVGSHPIIWVTDSRQLIVCQRGLTAGYLPLIGWGHLGPKKDCWCLSCAKSMVQIVYSRRAQFPLKSEKRSRSKFRRTMEDPYQWGYLPGTSLNVLEITQNWNIAT